MEKIDNKELYFMLMLEKHARNNKALPLMYDHRGSSHSILDGWILDMEPMVGSVFWTISDVIETAIDEDIVVYATPYWEGCDGIDIIVDIDGCICDYFTKNVEFEFDRKLLPEEDCAFYFNTMQRVLKEIMDDYLAGKHKINPVEELVEMRALVGRTVKDFRDFTSNPLVNENHPVLMEVKNTLDIVRNTLNAVINALDK